MTPILSIQSVFFDIKFPKYMHVEIPRTNLHSNEWNAKFHPQYPRCPTQQRQNSVLDLR